MTVEGVDLICVKHKSDDSGFVILSSPKIKNYIKKNPPIIEFVSHPALIPCITRKLDKHIIMITNHLSTFSKIRQNITLS